MSDFEVFFNKNMYCTAQAVFEQEKLQARGSTAGTESSGQQVVYRKTFCNCSILCNMIGHTLNCTEYWFDRG